ncbi:paramyosin-like isoform X2 [Leptopilina heterotoma]|uniref:paramyosin-like isoform X2 n=1 Tax=Leptopilina heterotoma TaxID=63436 RepID=UPI001CA83E07|nr:paramyosin-like isoform X2 [Leptopilina heterotoma]
MDIRDKLLETVDANDPHFKILLKNAMDAEIKLLEGQLAAKRAVNERKRIELNNLLERRKALKKSIKEKSELLPVMEKASALLQEYAVKLLEELTLKQNMVDSDSLYQLSVLNQEMEMAEKLEKKCNEYEAEFEKAPLAQELKQLKHELLKIEVETRMREQNIINMEESYALYEKIQKKREQQQIIAIAKLWLQHRDNVEEGKKLRQESVRLNQLLAQQEVEIQCLMKEKEDKDKQNLMARFQMPPPVMDTKFVETMFSQSNILTTEAKNPDAMNDALSDTASICSSVFDEMCKAPEKTNIVSEPEEMEAEPDNISLGGNDDSQCTRDLDSEKSLQSPAIHSRKSYDSKIKEINENVYRQKIQSAAAKISDKSPRGTLSNLKRSRKNVSENIVEHSAAANSRVEVSKKLPRVDVNVTKGKKSNVSVQKNLIRNDKITENLGAVRKMKETMQSGEKNSYLANVNVTHELLDISEDSVTKDNDLGSENPSITESYSSFRFSDANVNQKDVDQEYNSDLSLQSFTNAGNDSVIFTEEELSNAENNVTLSEQNSPPQEISAPTSFGLFASQKKRNINFQGLFK